MVDTSIHHYNLRQRPVAKLQDPPSVPEARSTSQDDIPTFCINLSRPPSQRYSQLVTNYRPQIQTAIGLFDTTLNALYPGLPVSLCKLLARLFFRRVHSREETLELKGIAEAAGVELFYLVALNTWLDALMGCTSGAVKVRGSNDMGEGNGDRMCHFRTLDWDMEELRALVVRLDFVREDGGVVVARSISYAGFVGVLTGVRFVLLNYPTLLNVSFYAYELCIHRCRYRKSLSVSLNFRHNNNASSSLSASIRLWAHSALVCLGLRPSVSSLLRQYIIPSHTDASLPPGLESIRRLLPSVPTTCAYFTFCDGDRVLVIEKDHRTAFSRISTNFISITNHDHDHTESSPQNSAAAQPIFHSMSLTDLYEDSRNRANCINSLWNDAQAAARKKGAGGKTASSITVGVQEVVNWLETWPITNDSTHFACVMSPRNGTVEWVRWWSEPREDPNSASEAVGTRGSPASPDED